jgi:hypothetical protein
MEITPQKRITRIQILHHAFHHLEESYRKRHKVIGWRTCDNGTTVSPGDIWDKHAVDVGIVRTNFMHSTDGLLDRHKVIASTGRNILALQPLVFINNNPSAHPHSTYSQFPEDDPVEDGRIFSPDRIRIVPKIVKKTPTISSDYSDDFAPFEMKEQVHYPLNAVYAFYFGIQYLAAYNSVYSKEPFFQDSFFRTFIETDKGLAFIREHIKLVCTENLPPNPPVPLFWAAQLWFALEQWGLANMKLKQQ